jgi:hypothetical protein
MKPCSKNRKLIAWLALDALDSRQAEPLRAHLETCHGCRDYFEGISNVTDRLRSGKIRDDIQVPDTFHQRLVDSLKAQETTSVWKLLAGQLRTMALNWRVMTSLVGAGAIVIMALLLFVRRPDVPSPASTGAQPALTSKAASDLDPTISNYRIIANRSLEKLDEILTKQGNRNPAPLPIYTASILPRADAAD